MQPGFDASSPTIRRHASCSPEGPLTTAASARTQAGTRSRRQTCEAAALHCQLPLIWRLENVSCESLPPVMDYSAPGPFGDAKMFSNTGPNNNYTLFRPDASLGKNGFKHPIATWGNGILTTPDMYQRTLPLIATHGFVIIACNDTQAERACLSDGMDWLIAQNDSGEMAGTLDTTREIAIGYSWGGGAAIDVSDRPNIRATVSLHGMPRAMTRGAKCTLPCCSSPRPGTTSCPPRCTSRPTT
jgi:hypothetical protein